MPCCNFRQLPNFNPRSLAGATADKTLKYIYITISIHAPLRERHDVLRGYQQPAPISIHAPLRERRRPPPDTHSEVHFNPRSLAGATCGIVLDTSYGYISIHAPLRERPLLQALMPEQPAFQSTLPCGSDSTAGQFFYRLVYISIHAPLRERRNRVLTPLAKV